MIEALTRICLTVSIVAGALFVWRQDVALKESIKSRNELAFRRDHLRHELNLELDFNQRLLAQDARTLQQVARDRGYHLVGEVDWWVIEQQNALLWPEIWGTMDIGRHIKGDQ